MYNTDKFICCVVLLMCTKDKVYTYIRIYIIYMYIFTHIMLSHDLHIYCIYIYHLHIYYIYTHNYLVYTHIQVYNKCTTTMNIISSIIIHTSNKYIDESICVHL